MEDLNVLKTEDQKSYLLKGSNLAAKKVNNSKLTKIDNSVWIAQSKSFEAQGLKEMVRKVNIEDSADITYF